MDLFSRLKALLFPLGFLLLLIISFTYWFLLRPPSSVELIKVIEVKKGMSLRKVSLMLEHEGIIRNAQVFTGIATFLGKKADIKAGEYEFHTRMRPLVVLNTLVKGQVKRHLVTIAEGYTLSQIAQLLDDLGIVEKKAFLEKASSPAFISSLGIPYLPMVNTAPTLEGYLFPDTYHLIREMNPEEIIWMMIHRFKKVFGPDQVDRAHQLGMSPGEVVILASIIEKETSLLQEKPLISAVFHNRLKKKIPLQSDPTVIYGIKNFSGNLTKAHLQQPTSYNTYLYLGLPPTPICSPGRDSLLAALYPSAIPYLYFVSRNDGSHHFSSTIDEHNRAVLKYQKKASKNNLTKK
jgi:UPF0755 protein